jgi:D-glycero-alpha-D-manno-heptose-7-phosphate kinase
MKDALLHRQLNEFGDLLGTAWRYKKQMSPRITTPFIDEAYEQAIGAGALGGKVTGAGGGGYMLFFCPFHRKHKVAEALIALGAPVTEFEFARHGLTTWSFDA